MDLKSDKTILVVDDDAAVLMALEKRLRHAGYQVRTSADGQTALELARQGGIDAMTLDVALPGGPDGLSIAESLSKDPRTGRIPIVFVTGSADSQFQEKSRAAGGKYFIAKPYDADLLIRLMDGSFACDELGEITRISQAKRRQPVG